MNKVFLVGRLTADPTVNTGAKGGAIASFRFAADTFRKGEDGKNIVNFFSVSAFGQLATHVSTYCKKGDKVAISGDLVFRPYVDKNGVQRFSNDVAIQNLDFCSPKGAAADGDAPANAPARTQSAPAEEEAGDDELPF